MKKLSEGGPLRVVITGMGVISLLGHKADETWQSLLSGHSGWVGRMLACAEPI